MDEQVRLTKVMMLLVAAMTGGALLLLALEGKPIQPMSYSLASQAEFSSVQAALGTETSIQPGRWQRIEIHCRDRSALRVGAEGLTGDLGVRYHFVISDGGRGSDGQIYASDRWAQQLACLNLPASVGDARTIRICILTQGSGRSQPTPRQTAQLDNLISSLVRHCHIQPRIVWNPS